jgi:hypothetical protein
LAALPRKSGGVPASPRRRRPHATSKSPAARGSRLRGSSTWASLKHSTRGPQKPPGYFTGCPRFPEGSPSGDRSPGLDPGPSAFWPASIERSLALVGDKAPGHDRQCSALSDQPACRADAGHGWMEGHLGGFGIGVKVWVQVPDGWNSLPVLDNNENSYRRELVQAPFEMHEGRDRLKKIIEDFPADSTHWNEAQNRFQFIDRLLTECLGWEKPDMLVEETDDGGGRSDYIFGGNKAVLEAKREAKLWELLPKSNTKSLYSLRSQVTSCKNFSDVVRQVIPYAVFQGCSLAIVCNGPQLAIFLPVILGKKPLDGYCFMFNGFESYVKDFPQLWSLLSPEGVSDNRAYRSLSDRHNIRIPAKASAHIPEPKRFRYRSDLQTELREIGSFLLEEIEDNPAVRSEFYREC